MIDHKFSIFCNDSILSQVPPEFKTMSLTVMPLRLPGSGPETRASRPSVSLCSRHFAAMDHSISGANLGGQFRLIHAFGTTIPVLVSDAGRELSDVCSPIRRWTWPPLDVAAAERRRWADGR